jgi:alkanesulfonate monooxygenase SsuD/methylene tetrahydromethanopterin reductase-like flavin-dependent oxidoreductase (luciferase family)
VYKRGRWAARFELYPSAHRKNPNCLLKPLAARLPSLLLLVGDLARVKQTARRRRRYVAMPSSSSSAATPPADASSEETLSTLAAEELRAGDTVDFSASRMSSVRVQDMQRLGYFGGGVARVPGAEEVPEPEGELVVFEAFFACPRIDSWERSCADSMSRSTS